MLSLFGALFGLGFVFGSPFLVVVLLVAASRSKERKAEAAFVRPARAFAAVIALLFLAAIVLAVSRPIAAPVAPADDASEKARALGEGISEFLNASAFVTAVALAGTFALFVWRKRTMRDGNVR